MRIELELNGTLVEIVVDNGLESLLDVLRRRLGLTGTKRGCGGGECGACAVLLDGESVFSCLIPIGQLPGRRVRTIEGLAATDRGRRAAELLAGHGAVQCGFCTPGFVVALCSEDDAPEPDRFDGHLCRCTGYTAIRAAIEEWEGSR